MPPETFSWDRKEFFRDRKHERSSEPHHYSHPHPHPHPHQISRGGGYGGVGGISGGGNRWREQHLVQNTHNSYQHHGYDNAPARWTSDVRGRAGPPGYGKQGGRHIYPEEEGHGLVPCRSSDKSSMDGSFRASSSGKIGRNSRENRSAFCQKEGKGQFSEPVPSQNGPGRPNVTVDESRLMDDALTSNSSNPQTNLVNLQDQTQPKKQHDKHDTVDAIKADLLIPEGNLSGSVDWKCTKWTRSGSFSSRGSGFSHSNSSKSMGVDSKDTKEEVQQTNVSPILCVSGDAVNAVNVSPAACKPVASPSEETSSRKKPRLRFGEGLAKYEKKKVVGLDGCGSRNELLICGNSVEQMNMDSKNSADGSPTTNALSVCVYPAPSAVGFTCSPGIEGKQCVVAGSFDHGKVNLIVSPSIESQNHVEDSTFNLESLDLGSIACLNSSIDKLLESDVHSPEDSDFVRSTALNKLSVWRSDVLKAIESTESEIDKLEGLVKSMAELEVPCLPGSASSSLSSDGHSKLSGNHEIMYDISHQPAPLNVVLDGESDVHKKPKTLKFQQNNVKGEDVESPGSATSKLVDRPFSRDDHVQITSKPEIDTSGVMDANCPTKSVYDLVKCDGFPTVYFGFSTYPGDVKPFLGEEDELHGLIWASNRDMANEAAEECSKLLPNMHSTVDMHTVAGIPCVESSEIVKDKLLKRKRFQKFKERTVALKFRLLQNRWKEDVRLLSSKKHRVRSQKKLDHSFRALQNGHKKYHFPIHTRLSSPARNLTLTPDAETVKFVHKLISDSQLKPLRNGLKMPALILDKKEKMARRFVSTNGMVEDPWAVEKERSMTNFWSEEEKEIFLENFAAHGKDFSKIASLLTHKTTADCIEFYYKNHKSDSFKKTKKHPDLSKQGKTTPTNNYLVASGKRLICEANAASLDILGAASEIAATDEDCIDTHQKRASRNILGTSSKILRGSSCMLERSSSLDVDRNERETAAADVLAGICSSLSSEAMGSCITSAADAGDGYYERKYQKICSSNWRNSEPEIQTIDETCSDDNCGDTDTTDWTDEEKSTFIQSVSSNGKDFATISRCVRTRSRDQCKIFFSKARKSLALDSVCPGSIPAARIGVNVTDEDMANGCVEADSGISDEKPVTNMEVDLPSHDLQLNSERDVVDLSNTEPALNRLETDDASILEPIDTRCFSGNLINDDSHEEKPDQGADVEDAMCRSSKPVEVPDEGTSVISSGTAAPQVGKSSNLCDVPDSQPVYELLTYDLIAEEPMVSGMRTSQISKQYNTDPSDATHSADDKDANLKARVIDDDNTVGADIASLGCGDLLGNLRNIGLESVSSEKPCVMTLQQNNYPVPMKWVSQVSSAANLGVSKEGKTGAVDIGSIRQDNHNSRSGEHHLSVSSLLGSVGGQILEGYAAPEANLKGLNGKNSFFKPVDRNLLDDQHLACGGLLNKCNVTKQICSASERPSHSLEQLQNVHFMGERLGCDSLLKKCNGTKQSSSASERPLHSLEQLRNNCSQLDVSLGMEKPRQSGKVKLFGQILTKPPHQKWSPVVRQTGEGESDKVGRFFNFRPAEDQSVGGSKLDCNSSVGSENARAASYGFWDGSRIQTGFPLPNSSVLIQKYPDGYNNNSLPSKDQLPSHGVNGGSRNLNGLSIFPAREHGSSNGTAEQQVCSNDLPSSPSALMSMPQPKEMLLLEMQRNGFEGVSVGQQTAARGMNGGGGMGGIVVGGQCSGISDPVAAIRMHFAHAERLNGQAGSIDDPWRGQGNVGM